MNGRLLTTSEISRAAPGKQISHCEFMYSSSAYASPPHLKSLGTRTCLASFRFCTVKKAYSILRLLIWRFAFYEHLLNGGTHANAYYIYGQGVIIYMHELARACTI